MVSRKVIEGKEDFFIFLQACAGFWKPERSDPFGHWIKNAGDSKHFSKKAMVFECFHNFVAFSQWGNTIFGVMSRLSENGGDTQVRDALAYFWGSVEGGAGTEPTVREQKITLITTLF